MAKRPTEAPQPQPTHDWQKGIQLASGIVIPFSKTELVAYTGKTDILRANLPEGRRIIRAVHIDMTTASVTTNGTLQFGDPVTQQEYDNVKKGCRILQALNSRKIGPKVYEYVEPPIKDLLQTGTVYVVMEEISGSNLDGQQKEGKTFSQGDAVTLVNSVLDTLRIAHEELGIIHTDVSTRNIVGKVLLDWDTALLLTQIKPLQVGESVFGKYFYAPPEQFGAPSASGTVNLVGRYTDTYAAGVVLFTLLTDTNLLELFVHRGAVNLESALEYIKDRHYVGDMAEILRANKNIDPNLIKVVLKATDPDPINRYQTAADFQKALKPFLPKHWRFPFRRN